MDSPVTTSVFGVVEAPPSPFLTHEELAEKIIGVAVDDRYRVQAQLGQGGMGGVYKAVHLGLSKTVAIKILWPELASNVNALARFQREAKAASSLNHPGLVSVSDYGLLKNFQAPYLVMQYVEGKNLADILQHEYRLTIPRTLNIFIQICDALAHAHEHGVIHRDIKPSNIILQNIKGIETVQIVDFGIAMLMSSFSQEQSITASGDVAGSPQYMSPEQCMSEHVDCRTDTYSVACVMYETITGRPVFTGRNSLHTMYKQMHEEPDFSVFEQLRLPPSLRRILVKGLLKKRDQRYQSIMELRADLIAVRDQIFRSLSQRLIRWQSRSFPEKCSASFQTILFVLGWVIVSFYMWQSTRYFLHVP
ncbi:MAG TPA: serine/threonine-protein kinase [Planktothrix sp.]|jgi:serine/threonine-protein kinase